MYKYFTVLVIILSAVTLSGAEETRNVTLQECINIALQNHSDLFVSIEDRKIAASNYKIANSANSIIINGEIKTVEIPKTTDSATTDAQFKIPGKDSDIGLLAGLSAQYNIYDKSKHEKKESARLNIDLSKVNTTEVKNNILYNVKKSYLGYFLANSNVELQKRLLDKFQTKLKLAQMLFNNGMKPVLDVTKAQVGLAEARLELEKARNQERLMKVNLFSAIGIKKTEDINIIPQQFERLPEVKYTLGELYRLAEMHNPAINASRINKKIKRIQIEVQRDAHYPKVDFLLFFGFKNEYIYGFNSDLNRFDENFSGSNWNPTFTGTVRASLPVYSGGAISAKVDTAISEYNKMVYKEKETVMKIKNLVLNDYRSIGELSRQYNMTGLIIENSKKHLLLAQRSYENGAGSLLELQDAEMSVIKAEQGRLTAKHNYFLALADLSRLLGVDEGLLCK